VFDDTVAMTDLSIDLAFEGTDTISDVLTQLSDQVEGEGGLVETSI